MAGKLLFFDVDGTLVDEQTGKIPESTIEGLEQARRNGHFIFVNTGRTASIMQACLKELPVDGYAYACGSHITWQGEELLNAFVNMEDIEIIRSAMIECRIQGNFQGPETCYFDVESLSFLRHDSSQCYENYKKFLNKIYISDYHGKLKSYFEDQMQVNKLVTFREEKSDYDGFVQKMKKEYQLIENGNGFTEILPLSYTKATCIDYLAAFFKKDRKDCYVFGDSPNDLPMMNHVKYSIAMGNSYPEVKEKAFYVTKDVSEDGIYHALRYLSLV